MAQRDTQFSYFRVTNGHMLFSGEEKAKKLGCTGEIEVESEIRTVTKKCEGIDTEKRTQVTGQKIKFVGHIEREVLNRSEEHTSELQSRQYLVCRLLLEKKKKNLN